MKVDIPAVLEDVGDQVRGGLQQPTSVALGPTVDGWYWQAGETQYGSVMSTTTPDIHHTLPIQNIR